MPDTGFIRYLQNTYGYQPDSALQPMTLQQQALGTACSTLIEEVLAPVFQYYLFDLEEVQIPALYACLMLPACCMCMALWALSMLNCAVSAVFIKI